MQERFTELKRAYQSFIATGNESYIKEFREELSYWGDHVNSPLFPRQQTRLYHSYINDSDEPTNPAYKILENPENLLELLRILDVDMLILGHEAQKTGKVKDLSGTGKVLIIDGMFSKKGGEVGATETGAGLYIAKNGKSIYTLHLLKVKEILSDKSDRYKEVQEIIKENLRLRDIFYYNLEIYFDQLEEYPKVLEELKLLCGYRGIDYGDFYDAHKGKKLTREIVDGLLKSLSAYSINYILGDPYPTRFVFPAVIEKKNW